MIRVPIQIDFKHKSNYKITLNQETVVEHSQASIGFDTHWLEPKRLQALTIHGNVEVSKLVLDGIDTEYFIHHGFVNGGYRGNQTTENLTYYFKVPIWRWYIEWIQHDNSYFRKLSQAHQGFLPL
tara:strand:+ start:440 stop:814 length:375 start_codon:yes stop_codon:yes gene_type:complete